jgi:hypothetical protein
LDQTKIAHWKKVSLATERLDFDLCDGTGDGGMLLVSQNGKHVLQLVRNKNEKGLEKA